MAGADAKSLFRHDRLTSSRSIRLLRLVGSAEFDVGLELQLFEAGLDETSCRPAYEALSYVWDSLVGTQPVSCNKQLLFITPNCESALRRFRLKDKDRIMWIDAICIDQEDTDATRFERSMQVALMGEIYNKADRTLCWLGEGLPFTKLVMQRLEQIGNCPSMRGLGKLMSVERQLRAEAVLGDDTSCLDHIFCHPWHTRVWTVQEVAFSGDCQIVCGASSMSWEHYFNAARFLIFDQFIDTLDLQASRNMVSIDMRNVFRDYVFGNESATSVDDYEAEDYKERKVTFLSSCLTDITQLRSTDPKDKLYGLHALYTRLGVPLPTIDYNKSVASVYTEAAIAMISWSQSLSILADACTLNREHTLPSWVPDWNDAEGRMFSPTCDATSGSCVVEGSANILSPAPGKLRVMGKVIGTVTGSKSGGIAMSFPTQSGSDTTAILSGSGARVVEDVDFLRLLIDKIKFFRQLLRVIRARGHQLSDEPAEDVFHDIITIGQRSFQSDLFEMMLDILAYPSGKCDQSAGRTLATRWRAADDTNASHWSSELLNCATIVASLLSNSITLHGAALPSHDAILELVKEMSENLGDHAVRSFQLESQEQYSIGTTFREAKAADALVLLQGADWPVVLRPASGEWRFIGTAFVIGIMDGEAWLEDGGGPSDSLRDFVLV